MTRLKTDGGHAFPFHENSVEYGMTMLDYFAAQVAPGIVASKCYDPRHVAGIAYDIAEDLVNERQRRYEARQKSHLEYLRQPRPMSAHNDLNSPKNKV